MPSKYESQVEVVVAMLIVFQGRVLLMQSPKWSGVWLFPGGHVEYGETLFEAACREGREETGLSLRPVSVVQVGENIFSPTYHRPAHMIYFHVVCEADTDQLTLDEREVGQAVWFRPDELPSTTIPSNVVSVQRWQSGQTLPYDGRQSPVTPKTT